MRDRYLEVTFRRGRALAAYLYLPRRPGAKSARTVAVTPGVLADYAADGALIGLELTAPLHLTREVLAGVDAFLAREGVAGVSSEELTPIAAAA